MKDVPENELFSAYLDGELTAEEQAQMERLLAGSPPARQLLDELRALSASLQSLPVYRLAEDLSEPVLRAAERRTLSGQTEPDVPAAQEDIPISPWRKVAQRLSRPRVWLWPAVAAAAAILLAIFAPEEGRRIAKAPMEAPAAKAPAAAASPAPADAAPERKAIEASGLRGGEREHEAVLRDVGEKRGRLDTGLGLRREAVDEKLGILDPAKDAPARSSAARELPPAAERMRRAAPGGGQEFKMEAAGREWAEERGKPAQGPPAAASLARPSAPAPAVTTPAKAADSSPYAMPFKKAAAMPGMPGLAAGQGPAPPPGAPPPAEKLGEPGAVELGQNIIISGKTGDEVLVVQCQVAAEAIDRGYFEQVLAKRQIALAEPPQEFRSLDRFDATKPEQKPEKPAAALRGAPVDQKPDRPAESLGRLVYLRAEATSAQLDAALAELKASPGMVRSVASFPARGNLEDLVNLNWDFSSGSSGVPPTKAKGGFGGGFGRTAGGEPSPLRQPAGDVAGATQTIIQPQQRQIAAPPPPALPESTAEGQILQRGQSVTSGRIADGRAGGRGRMEATPRVMDADQPPNLQVQQSEEAARHRKAAPAKKAERSEPSAQPAGQRRMAAQQQAPSRPEGALQENQPAPVQAKLNGAVQSAEPEVARKQMFAYGQVGAKQRVLFVLRVVDAVPPMAAEIGPTPAAGAKADAAKAQPAKAAAEAPPAIVPAEAAPGAKK